MNITDPEHVVGVVKAKIAGKLNASKLDHNNFRKVLEVSTAHIPERTANALGQNVGDPMDAELWDHLSYVPWHEYGWIIQVSEDAVAAAREHAHPELAALLQLALDDSYTYLQLDRDAAQLPPGVGAPEFDWNEQHGEKIDECRREDRDDPQRGGRGAPRAHADM